MEREANYAWVAVATAVLVMAALAFGLWLGRLGVGQSKALYDVGFSGPVSGLARGAEVRFNGMRVGEVVYVGIAPGQSDRVLARISIASDTPVRVSSRARIEPQPVGGLTQLQISAGAPDTPLLRTQYPKDVVPVLFSEPTPLLELLNNSGSTLVQTSMLLQRVNAALSESALAEVNNRLSEADRLTTDLAERRIKLAEFQRAISEASEALDDYRRTAQRSKDWTNGDAREAIQQINRSTVSAVRGIDAFSVAVENGVAPIDRFAAEGLPELNATLLEIEAGTRAVRQQIEILRATPRSPGRDLKSKPLATPGS